MMAAMAREAIGTWFFSLVIVREGDRFLLVHERKHGQLWYLPAGRVEPGETLAEAAVRETLEESGVDVELEGLLRLEHRPLGEQARVRAFFVARPRPGSTPRTTPNEHSLGARWVTLDELATLPLRGDEVIALCRYAATDPPLLPMSMVVVEGEP
jgi:phosphatase NudJ